MISDEIESITFSPIASVTSTPASGSTNTVFEFDGSDSYDDETFTYNLKLRWDWENDGNWDEAWSTDKHIKHRFLFNGIYSVKMEVMDAEGYTHDTTMQIMIKNFTPCPDPGGSYFQVAGNPEKEKQWERSFEPMVRALNKYGQAGWNAEMFLEANEEYFGKDKKIIVFKVPASCR